MFDVNNSRDFYAKLLADFDDLMANQDSGRHVMNCAITAHHVHDWVWNDFLKNDADTRKQLGIAKDKTEFVKWIERNSIWFGLIRAISNGSKHAIRDEDISSRSYGFYVGADYVDDGYVERGFALDHRGADHLRTPQSIPVSHLLEVVVRFWRNFFLLHGPYRDDLPTGKTQLGEP